MSDVDTPLHHANRAAHRGMKVLCNSVRDDAYQGRWQVILERFPELMAVVRDYEDAQRRAQMEATR